MLKKEVGHEYFLNIKEGKKVYEGRLFDKKQEWQLEKGKRMYFYDKEYPECSIMIEVTTCEKFSDFGTMYDKLKEKLLPNKSKEEAINIYNNIYHYPDENVEELNSKHHTSQKIKDIGALAIGFVLVD